MLDMFEHMHGNDVCSWLVLLLVASLPEVQGRLEEKHGVAVTFSYMCAPASTGIQ